MADINANILRWESGGTLAINWGTAYTVLNIKSGSLKITPPTRERVPVMDRSVAAIPIEGNDIPGEWEFEVNFGAGGATGLSEVLREAGSATTGKVADGTITAVAMAGRGGSAARTWALTSCWLEAQGLVFTAGEDNDKLTAKGKYLGHSDT